MSRSIEVQISCPFCGFSQIVSVYTSVNVTLDPDLRERILNDNINRFTCMDCGKTSFIAINLIYHDMERKFAVWFSPQGDIPEKEREAFKKVTQSLGIGHYLYNAPRASKWEEFKKTILEFEKNRA